MTTVVCTVAMFWALALTAPAAPIAAWCWAWSASNLALKLEARRRAEIERWGRREGRGKREEWK